mmetsp:Transcript_16800/g.45792  ORF Transcript_16800/g.45792 Transcript_16800/m.45792 type:complete len:324 (+) Transcript_16800:2074-3045(+)
MDDTDVITTAKLEDVFNNIDQNVKYLVEASASNARGAASLNVMQIVLAGSFCFAIIDRISGATFSFNPPNWAYDYIFQPIIDKPGVFFALNIIWLLICSYGLLRFMNYLQDSAMGTLTLRVTINKKLKSKKGMETFFSTKALDNLESEIWVGNPTVRMVEWEETDEEKWLGSAPFIEFAYDATNLFLLSLELSIDKKTSTATEEVLNVPSVRHAVLGFEAAHPAVMQLFSCLDDDRKLGLCGLLGDIFFFVLLFSVPNRSNFTLQSLVNTVLQDLVAADAMDREVAFGEDVLGEDMARAQQAQDVQQGGKKPASISNLFGLLG